MSGSNRTGESGVYGAMGLAAASNFPGGRRAAVSWIDSFNNLWLFGGFGRTGNGFEAGLSVSFVKK
jgi:hypothetical protein